MVTYRAGLVPSCCSFWKSHTLSSVIDAKQHLGPFFVEKPLFEPLSTKGWPVWRVFERSNPTPFPSARLPSRTYSSLSHPSHSLRCNKGKRNMFGRCITTITRRLPSLAPCGSAQRHRGMVKVASAVSLSCRSSTRNHTSIASFSTSVRHMSSSQATQAAQVASDSKTVAPSLEKRFVSCSFFASCLHTPFVFLSFFFTFFIF